MRYPTCEICGRAARRRVRVNDRDHLYCQQHDFPYQPNTDYTVQASMIDPPDPPSVPWGRIAQEGDE